MEPYGPVQPTANTEVEPFQCNLQLTPKRDFPVQPTANAKAGFQTGNSFFIGGNSSTVAQLSTVVPVEIDTPMF